MDATEIKAKLAEVDAQLAGKLRELGFTEDEIARQLDHSIPKETRKAEAEKILARKFTQDLNDPSSGLMAQVVAKAIADMEQAMPGLVKEMEEARARRRRNIFIGVACGAVCVALVLYFVTRTPSVTKCEKLANPVDELGAIVGKKLTAGQVVDMGDYCTLVLGDDSKQSVITILVSSSRNFPGVRSTRDGQPFSKRDMMKVATGDAFIYLQGDPNPDASGRNEILFELGSQMVEIDIERDTSEDKVRALADTIAKRAKR